jgi:hypothetical protein
MSGPCPHCGRLAALYPEICSRCGGKLQLGWIASAFTAILLVGGLALALDVLASVYRHTHSIWLMITAGTVATLLLFLVLSAFYSWRIEAPPFGPRSSRAPQEPRD